MLGDFTDGTPDHLVASALGNTEFSSCFYAVNRSFRRRSNWGEGYSFFRFLSILFVYALYSAAAATVLFFPVRRHIRRTPIL